MPRRRLRGDVELLLKQGFHVPPELHKLAAGADRQERGLAQVWECKKCEFEYESEVNITGIDCPNGHVCKLIWHQVSL